MIRTLGIDLASTDANTAACVVEWDDSQPRLTALLPSGVSDDDIEDFAKTADVTAIDAPFGWPRPFAEALTSYDAGASWPAERTDALWFRTTDMHAKEVTQGRPPLSVSSDRIARPAVRAARLLTRLGPEGRPAARDGSDNVIEVYPAGAMRCWGLDTKGYKRPHGVAAREQLAAHIVEALGLSVGQDERTELSRTDHAVDALVASIVGRAFAMGLVLLPPPGSLSLVRAEGWLYLPTGQLGDLAS